MNRLSILTSILSLVVTPLQQSLANVGGRHLCEVDEFYRIDSNYERPADYRSKFRFEFDRSETQIKFQSDFYFEGKSFKIQKVDGSSFAATGPLGTKIYYSKSQFYLSSITPFSVTAMKATCTGGILAEAFLEDGEKTSTQEGLFGWNRLRSTDQEQCKSHRICD
jgi:hypothetical protein